MVKIKYDLKNATMVIDTGSWNKRNVREATLEKEEASVRIKGIEYFPCYAFQNETSPHLLKNVKDEFIKTKTKGIFKKRLVRYIPKDTLYELKKTEPINLLISSFLIELE